MQQPIKVVGKVDDVVNSIWIDGANVTKVACLRNGVLRLTVKGEPGPGTIDVDDLDLIKEALATLGIAMDPSTDDANADMPGI